YIIRCLLLFGAEYVKSAYEVWMMKWEYEEWWMVKWEYEEWWMMKSECEASSTMKLEFAVNP
ncbi:hypothetical protein A2U01_0081099, partial [Trifolium medium]|nr:hypothetical protein [Trifolium medium]